MQTIKEIKLRDEMVEKENGKTYYTDSVYIRDDGLLHVNSFDYGPEVERLWGDDYEYDIYVEKEWKDSILLLLLQEKFKSTSDFKKWLDSKGVLCTTSLR
jgi:hypothetical protein